MTISSQEQFQQPIVGHRYRMRRGTKAERIRINESWPAYPCGFCGAEAPPEISSGDAYWSRLFPYESLRQVVAGPLRSRLQGAFPRKLSLAARS